MRRKSKVDVKREMGCIHSLHYSKFSLPAPKTSKRDVIWETNKSPRQDCNCPTILLLQALECHIQHGSRSHYEMSAMSPSTASVFLRLHKYSLAQSTLFKCHTRKGCRIIFWRHAWGCRKSVLPELFSGKESKNSPEVTCQATFWNSKGTWHSTKGLPPLDTSLVSCLLTSSDSGEHLSWTEGRGEGSHLIWFFPGMLGFRMELHNSIQNPSIIMNDVWL